MHPKISTFYRICFTLAAGIIVTAWLYAGAYGFMDGDVDIGYCVFYGVVAGAFAWFVAGGPWRRRATAVALSVLLAFAAGEGDVLPDLCWIAAAISMLAWLSRDVVGEWISKPA